MDKKVTDLGDALMALTTAEAIELQNYLESKGLKPAQPTIVQASGSTKEADEEKELFYALKIVDPGLTKLKAVAKFKELTGLGLKEAKEVFESGEPLFKNRTVQEISNSIKELEMVSSGLIGEIIDQDHSWE